MSDDVTTGSVATPTAEPEPEPEPAPATEPTTAIRASVPTAGADAGEPSPGVAPAAGDRSEGPEASPGAAGPVEGDVRSAGPVTGDTVDPPAGTVAAPPESGSVVPGPDAPDGGGTGEAGTGSGTDESPADAEEGEGDEDDRSYELPRILAIANQKGGVGKTTTSVNLGAALAERGYRVLVVDLDPQGNATTGLGVNARELQGSIYDVIMNDAAIEDCVEPTTLKNLFVAPATIDLAGAEIELVPAFSRELKLRRALHEIKDDYDYMIIDCPPSLGLLTVNGLAAADDVIVPIQCEYYALEGLSQLIRNVSLVQRNLNPSLDVRGIVLTMYDARTKLADQVEQEVRNHFGRTVYETVVPRTVRLSEAPSFGQPIILFDPTSRGAVAYRELAKEVSSGATRRSG